MTGLRLFRYAAWGILAGVLIALALVNMRPGDTTQVTTAKTVGSPQIGGEFTLIDQTGGKRSWSDFRDKATAVFFGFTHCPDVCPATLWELSQRLKELGSEADRLNVVLITVDPERDTPAVLRSYLQSFDPRIVALTGADVEVEKAVKVFRAHRKRVPTEGGNYTMDHSALVWLFDAGGEFRSTVDRHETAAIQLQKLKRVLERPLISPVGS